MGQIVRLIQNALAWFRSQFSALDYRGALVFYTLFMILWYTPFLFLGQVIAPRLDPTVPNTELERLTADEIPFVSRSFPTNPAQHSDYQTVYVPDIAGEINEPHYQWINTWMASFGFGQAFVPLQRGLSVTYFPTYVVSLFVDNPFVLATIITMSFHFLAGFVFTDYMRLLKLHPVAALAGGIIYGTQAPFSYYPTQNPFTLPLVFVVVLIYLLHRIIQDRHWIWIFLLAIAVQSTIQVVYLQSQVFLFYILIGYIAYLFLVHIKQPKERIAYLTTLCIGGVIGLLMTAPVLLDFVHNAINSARTPVTISRIHTIFLHEFHITLGYFIPALFDRNPSPVGTNIIAYLIAHYLTSVITMFSVFGAVTTFKRSWGWLSLFIFMVLVSFQPQVALFFMQNFSANISSWGTFYYFFGLLPIIILSAYGIDAAIRYTHTSANPARLLSWTRFGVVVLILTILLVYLQAGINAAMQPRWLIFGFEVMLVGGFFFVTHPTISQKLRAITAVVMVMTTSLFILFPAIPRQPASDMLLSGLEFKVIQDTIKPDEYQANVSSEPFAKMGWKCCLYNGGHNSVYGVHSIHGNFLLPPQRYVDLMSNFGYESGNYDKLYKYKHYFSINNNFDSLDFWMMNIGVVVSREQQNHPNLTLVRKVNRWYIYRHNAKGCCLQIPLTAINPDITTPASVIAQVTTNIDPRTYAYDTLTKSVRYSDYFEIPLAANQPSLIIISQSYHDYWQAEALVNNQWVRTDTIAVNGKYLGAFTPDAATSIRFTFKPWALWAWIPHSIWALGLLAIVMRRYIDRRIHQFTTT